MQATEAPKAELQLGGPVVFGGLVSYSLKDRHSCDYISFFSNYGNPLKLGESHVESIAAGQPIVVEFIYHFRPPVVSCIVAAEFTPEGRATYQLFFDEITFVASGGCEPRIMKLDEAQKKYVNSPFRKVCQK